SDSLSLGKDSVSVTDVWQHISDTKISSIAAYGAVVSGGMPTMGTSHPDESNLKVTNISLSKIEKSRVYLFDVEYSTGEEKEKNEDPLHDEVEISTSFQALSRPLDTFYSGTTPSIALLANGESFEGETQESFLLQINMTKNYSTSLNLLSYPINTINN